MKKIIKILIMSSLILVNIETSYGDTTVCAKTNTFVGVLSRKTNGTVIDVNTTNKTWKLEFDYGDNKTHIVTGMSACNKISGTPSTATTNLYTDELDVGNYCWCKMAPVPSYSNNTDGSETGLTSYWVFHGDMESNSECANNCAKKCATDMATDANFRNSVYNSIW